MKKIHALNFAVIALSCITVLSLAGSSLGALAWYAYNTNVGLAYQGTAVSRTEQLQIGLLWDRPADNAFVSDYGCEPLETIDGHTYYFQPAGTGFTSSAMNYYLSQKGYATNALNPITSGQYSSGRPVLKAAPNYTYRNLEKPADTRYYVEIPFAFRVITYSSSSTIDYVDGANVWLTNVTASAMGGGHVVDAIRLYGHNLHDDDDWLLSPSRTSSGFTYVAGSLDLNKDGYYDLERGSTNELVYGQYTETSPTKTTYSNNNFDNINGVEDTSTNSTFYARHESGATGYLSAFETNGLTRAKALYIGKEDVYPHKVDGSLTGDHAIAHTEEGTHLGRFDAMVYLEGWDHAVIDQLLLGEGTARFGLGLTFEIDKVS